MYSFLPCPSILFSSRPCSSYQCHSSYRVPIASYQSHSMRPPYDLSTGGRIRPLRLASEISRELGDIIEDSFASVRQFSGLISVVNVEMARDLKLARVIVKIESGDLQIRKEGLRVLKSLKKTFRYELAQRMKNVKGVPDLMFVEEKESSVERTLALIEKLEEERRLREESGEKGVGVGVGVDVGVEGGDKEGVGMVEGEKIVQGVEMGVESLKGEAIIDEEDEQVEDNEEEEVRSKKMGGEKPAVEMRQGVVVTKVWDAEENEEERVRAKREGGEEPELEMRQGVVVTKVWDAEESEEEKVRAKRVDREEPEVEMRHGVVVTKVWDVEHSRADDQVRDSGDSDTSESESSEDEESDNEDENGNEDEDEDEADPDYEWVEVIHTGSKSSWEYRSKVPGDPTRWVTKVWDAGEDPPREP